MPGSGGSSCSRGGERAGTVERFDGARAGDALAFRGAAPEWRPFELAEDLADHLFGGTRIDLEAVRTPLLELQRGTCFYCVRRVRAGDAHVDHVLPWSRTALDALANLVVADAPCNAVKSDLIPVAAHVRRAVNRALNLAELSNGLAWPIEEQRVLRTASGLLAFAPNAYVYGEGRSTFQRLDDLSRNVSWRSWHES